MENKIPGNGHHTDQFTSDQHPRKPQTDVETCGRCGRKDKCETLLKAAMHRASRRRPAENQVCAPVSGVQNMTTAMDQAVPDSSPQSASHVRTGSKDKGGTSSSNPRAGARKDCDSAAFYARFSPPQLSTDDRVEPFDRANRIFCEDSRQMPELPPRSVALVVTAPPFIDKECKEALGQGHIPGSYVEHLAMLRDVFAECKRVLEPGGRIAVNVANLGRRPCRSLSADIIGILQDDLGFLLLGEIIWVKATGASGDSARGAFVSAACVIG